MPRAARRSVRASWPRYRTARHGPRLARACVAAWGLAVAGHIDRNGFGMMCGLRPNLTVGRRGFSFVLGSFLGLGFVGFSDIHFQSGVIRVNALIVRTLLRGGLSGPRVDVFHTRVGHTTVPP